MRLYYGDFKSVARRYASRMFTNADNGPALDHNTASQYLLDCASGVSRGRLAELQSDPARALVWPEFEWYEEICAPWEVDIGDDFRLNFATDVPTVIVHGTWDISTPFDNALEVLPRFRNGKLVSVIGGSHGALGEAFDADPAFEAAFWTYLRTGDVEVMPDSVSLPPVDWIVPGDLGRLAIGSPNRDPR